MESENKQIKIETVPEKPVQIYRLLEQILNTLGRQCIDESLVRNKNNRLSKENLEKLIDHKDIIQYWKKGIWIEYKIGKLHEKNKDFSAYELLWCFLNYQYFNDLFENKDTRSIGRNPNKPLEKELNEQWESLRLIKGLLFRGEDIEKIYQVYKIEGFSGL